MSQVQSIIWDFAGVLLHTVNGKSFNARLAERLEVPLDVLQPVTESKVNDLWDMNEIGDDEFYTYLLNALQLPKEKESVIRHFVLKDFYVDQTLLAYIKDLKRSFTNVLLTNFPAHIHDFMQTDWIVNGAFDHMIASCDVKLIKPNPAIYELALERIGNDAGERVFIDDREVNVNAAEALGMHSIVYKTRKQTIKDLEKILHS